MTTLVRCALCGVWIPEDESKPTNELAPLLHTNFFPDHWRDCIDKQACVRRQKDKVGAASDSPHERKQR